MIEKHFRSDQPGEMYNTGKMDLSSKLGECYHLSRSCIFWDDNMLSSQEREREGSVICMGGIIIIIWKEVTLKGRGYNHLGGRL